MQVQCPGSSKIETYGFGGTPFEETPIYKKPDEEAIFQSCLLDANLSFQDLAIPIQFSS